MQMWRTTPGFYTDRWAATRVVTCSPFWPGLVLNQMSKHVWFKAEIVFLVSAEFISWVLSSRGRKERICVKQLFANLYEKSCVEKVKINFDMY